MAKELTYTISNDADMPKLFECIDVVRALLSHGAVSISIAPVAQEAERKRTITQNKALHKYFDLLATALNDAGLDMKRVLKPEIDIPWTAISVKEHLWRPIQEAMLDKHSTTEATTFDFTPVYETLNRHTSAKLGISIAWPSNEQRSKDESLRYYDEMMRG